MRRSVGCWVFHLRQGFGGQATLILGGGSNILFTKNYDGLVLKNEIKGIEELQTILEFICQSSSFKNEIRFDLTLARGLNYYTGTIIEVSSKSNSKLGSLGGGGRYDDMTSMQAVEKDASYMKQFRV